MKKERKLYDKFVDKLLELLDDPDITDKELRVIQNFLADNHIEANEETNEGLKELVNKFELPFDVEELEVER